MKQTFAPANFKAGNFKPGTLRGGAGVAAGGGAGYGGKEDERRKRILQAMRMAYAEHQQRSILDNMKATRQQAVAEQARRMLETQAVVSFHKQMIENAIFGFLVTEL